MKALHSLRLAGAATLTALSLLASPLVLAHEYTLGKLEIGHPYARSTVPGQPAGGAYLSIENKGPAADRLVALSSPVAKSAEIHTMSMEGNLMKMREVPDGLEIKPGQKIAMQPGNGYHIMLMGLTQPLKTGDKVPLTLTFQKAGKIEVSVYVEDVKAAGGAADHDMGDMKGMHHHQ